MDAAHDPSVGQPAPVPSAPLPPPPAWGRTLGLGLALGLLLGLAVEMAWRYVRAALLRATGESPGHPWWDVPTLAAVSPLLSYGLVLGLAAALVARLERGSGPRPAPTRLRTLAEAGARGLATGLLVAATSALASALVAEQLRPWLDLGLFAALAAAGVALVEAGARRAAPSARRDLLAALVSVPVVLGALLAARVELAYARALWETGSFPGAVATVAGAARSAVDAWDTSLCSVVVFAAALLGRLRGWSFPAQAAAVALGAALLLAATCGHGGVDVSMRVTSSTTTVNGVTTTNAGDDAMLELLRPLLLAQMGPLLLAALRAQLVLALVVPLGAALVDLAARRTDERPPPGPADQ